MTDGFRSGERFTASSESYASSNMNAAWCESWSTVGLVVFLPATGSPSTRAFPIDNEKGLAIALASFDSSRSTNRGNEREREQKPVVGWMEMQLHVCFDKP